mgnify:FL=1
MKNDSGVGGPAVVPVADPKPKSRWVGVIALLVVLAVVAGVAYYVWPDDAPPSFETSSGPMLGGMTTIDGGFPSFEQADLDAFAAAYPDGCGGISTEIRQGSHYYMIQDEISFEVFLASIEPVVDEQLFMALYSPGTDLYEEGFYFYPDVGSSVTSTTTPIYMAEATDLLPASSVVGVISSTTTEICDGLLPDNFVLSADEDMGKMGAFMEGLEANVTKFPKGWVIMPLAMNYQMIPMVMAALDEYVDYVWVQNPTAPKGFAKLDKGKIKDATMSSFYLVQEVASDRNMLWMYFNQEVDFADIETGPTGGTPPPEEEDIGIESITATVETVVMVEFTHEIDFSTVEAGDFEVCPVDSEEILVCNGIDTLVVSDVEAHSSDVDVVKLTLDSNLQEDVQYLLMVSNVNSTQGGLSFEDVLHFTYGGTSSGVEGEGEGEGEGQGEDEPELFPYENEFFEMEFPLYDVAPDAWEVSVVPEIYTYTDGTGLDYEADRYDFYVADGDTAPRFQIYVFEDDEWGVWSALDNMGLLLIEMEVGSDCFDYAYSMGTYGLSTEYQAMEAAVATLVPVTCTPELNDLTALTMLADAGCPWADGDDGVTVVNEDFNIVITKEGCTGECRINTSTEEISVVENPVCEDVEVEIVNLLEDGDMEADGVAAWEVRNQAVVTKESRGEEGEGKVLRITKPIGSTSNSPYVEQLVLDPEKTYSITGEGRQKPGITGMFVRIAVFEGNNFIVQGLSNVEGWGDFDMEFVSDGGNSLALYCVGDPLSEGAWGEFDNLVLTEVVSSE